MRDVSPAFKTYVTRLVDSGVVVWLMTLSHDGNVRSRITSHHEQVVSRGETFEPSPVKLRIPQANLLRSRTGGRLQLEGVSRTLTRWIRVECTQAPNVTLEVVMLASPNVLEYGPAVFKVGDVKFDNQEVNFPLVMDDLFKKPYQSVNFDPSRVPALFA